jgi:hypothetical protein
VHGFDITVEVGPGVVVVEAGVEELAAAQGGVAGLAEEVREGHPLGMFFDDGVVVAEDAGLTRQMAGKERGARGIAERELAVVAVEADATGGKGVDVGAVRVEAGVIAGELGAHVVGHEKENVEGAALRASCRLRVVGCRLGLCGRWERGGEGCSCGLSEERAPGGVLFFSQWVMLPAGVQCTFRTTLQVYDVAR